MEFRVAQPEEAEFVHAYLRSKVDFTHLEPAKTTVFVAVEDGHVLGFMCARLVWHLDPLIVLPSVKGKHKRMKIVSGVHAKCEEWIRGIFRGEHSGFRWMYAFTRNKTVAHLCEKVGSLRIYKHGFTFVKFLKESEHAE